MINNAINHRPLRMLDRQTVAQFLAGYGSVRRGSSLALRVKYLAKHLKVNERAYWI